MKLKLITYLLFIAFSGSSQVVRTLENVNNTTDLAKPISILTQRALDLKSNSLSPTFTGTSIFSNGFNVIGNGGVFNQASKFGIDFFGGATRFYSNGINTSTKGAYEFHGNSSDGIIDNIPLSIFSNINPITLTNSIHYGSVIVGTPSVAGTSLYINTASLNTSYSSGLGIDGTYSNPGGVGTSIVNIKAYGVNSGGGYNSNLAFSTAEGTVLTERMRILGNGNVGIGTNSPLSNLDVSGNINTNSQLWLSNGRFALWDGTFNRIFNRSGVAAFSIGNTQTYYDASNDHIFRGDGGTNLFTISTAGNFIQSNATKHLFGTQTDDGTANQFAGDVKVKGVLRMDDNSLMNNNQFQYWKDNIGTNRRVVGVGGDNTMHFGDIDNTMAGGSVIYSAKINHSFYNNGAINFRIAQNGNVGIGTTNPIEKFTTVSLDPNGQGLYRDVDVTTGTAGIISYMGAKVGTALTASSALLSFLDIGGSTGALQIQTRTAGALSTKMSIGSSGNVGIGTTSPTNTLHVTGGTAITSGWIKTATLESAFPVLLFNSTANGKRAGIGYDGTSNMNFWVNGSTDDVVATGITAVSIKSSNGYVGISTVTPLATLDVQGSYRAKLTQVSTNYTLLLTDQYVNITSGAVTATLPSAITCGAGFVYHVKNSSATTNTIATTSSQTIDGSTTKTITQFQAFQLVSNGANWLIY